MISSLLAQWSSVCLSGTLNPSHHGSGMMPLAQGTSNIHTTSEPLSIRPLVGLRSVAASIVFVVMVSLGAKIVILAIAELSVILYCPGFQMQSDSGMFKVHETTI